MRCLRIAVVTTAALVALIYGWMRIPNSLFYRQRRPTRLGVAVNRFGGFLAGLGMPPSWACVLEVKGRRSGETRSTVLVIADHDGDRYLVSMLGEAVEWVRNVRAAGGAAVIRHGRRRLVRLVEVPAAERAPVLRSYYHPAPGARPHMEATLQSTVADFERIAAGHPVFRIEPRAWDAAALSPTC
jgi:deazaflavin-dependent oxidoreductase (nitroreductase family)